MSEVRVVAWVPDLLDRSRFGPGTRFVTRPEELASVPADVVIVDLNRLDDLERVGAVSGRLLGFASHVDDDRLAAARSAGFDEALPRSVFFRRLPALLAGGPYGGGTKVTDSELLAEVRLAAEHAVGQEDDR